MTIQISLYLLLLCSNKVTKQAAIPYAGHEMVRFYGGGKESTGSALLLCEAGELVQAAHGDSP